MERWISVKEAFDRVYRESGFIPTSKASNDPNSKAMLEQESRKRALAHLEPEDRRNVDACIKRLKDTCPHVYLGDSAALQIIKHLGIILSEAAR